MTSRLRVLAAAAAATALLAPAAYGAPARPQVRDAKGDARGGMAELDIVSARWSTTGRGASKALVATLTLAAPPKDGVPYSYHLEAEVRDCGGVSFRYSPGSVVDVYSGSPGGFWASCGSVYDAETVVTGSTITWTIPLSVLPEQIGPGAHFSGFEAMADAGEPTFGYSVLGIADESLDYAQGDGTWRMP